MEANYVNLSIYPVGSYCFSFSSISSVPPRHEALADVPGLFITGFYSLLWLSQNAKKILPVIMLLSQVLCSFLFSCDWEAHLLLVLWLDQLLFEQAQWTCFFVAFFPSPLSSCFVNRVLVPRGENCLPSPEYSQSLCFAPCTRGLGQIAGPSSFSFMLPR